MPDQEPTSASNTTSIKGPDRSRLDYLIEKEQTWRRLVYPLLQILTVLTAVMIPAVSFTEIWLTQVPKYRAAMDKLRFEEEMERKRLGPENAVRMEEERAKVHAMQQEERILEQEIEVLQNHTNTLQEHEPSGRIRHTTSSCYDLGPIMERQSDLINNLIH